MRNVRPFRFPMWARWAGAWAAAMLLLVAGGSITLLMSQSSGCSVSGFSLSASYANAPIPAVGTTFQLKWTSSSTCSSEALVQSNVNWITPPSVTSSGGSGSGTFTVQSNSGSARMATITVGSLGSNGSSFNGSNVFLVTQAGAATPPAATIVYYAVLNQIFALNLLNGQSTVVDTAPAASQIKQINGLLFDTQGRIIYAGYNQSNPTQGFVRVYNPATGADTLLASGLQFPWELALDPSGSSVVVGDLPGSYRVSLPSGSGTATPVTLASAAGDLLSYDSQGNLYSAGSNRVAQIDPVSGAILNSSPQYSGVDFVAMTYDPFTNKLWFADLSANECLRSASLTTTTLSVSGCIVSFPSGVDTVGSLAADGAGNIWVASSSSVADYNVTSNNIAKTYAASGYPTGIAPLTGLGAPPACSYSLSSTNFSNLPSNTANYSVTVTTSGGGPGGCPWAASVTQGALTLSGQTSGTSSGTLVFTLTNNSSTSQQHDAISVAGQTISITQNGASASSCAAPSLSSSSLNVGSSSMSYSGSFTVSVPSGCTWNATSGSSFLTVTSTNISNGTVNYTASANTTGSSRSGTITVATNVGSAMFTLNQVVATAALTSTAPSSCSAPASQKYVAQNSPFYAWFASAPGNGSDNVSVQIFLVAGTQPLNVTTLATKTGCFYAPINLGSSAPNNYTAFFYLNNTLAGSAFFTIVGNQVTVSISGAATNPSPGLTQENIQTTLPKALSDNAQLSYATNFTVSGGVTAAASPGAYDCNISAASVTIPAGQTQSPNATFSGGTVAGNCSATVSQVSLPTLNFAPAVTGGPTITNSAMVPQITSVAETASGGTLTLVVTGYSLTRDLSNITYTFTPASGFSITSAQLPVNVQSGALSWYQGASSAATGGQFQYTQSFNLSSATSADLSSVAVTVTSSTGTSPSMTATLH